MDESQQHSKRKSYVLSLGGILKVMQFITLLLAWIFFFVFKGQTSPENYKDWKEISFLIMHFVGCVAALLFYFLYVAGLENKIESLKCFYASEVLVQLCLALCCAVISSQWSKWAYDNQFYHEALSPLYRRWIFLLTALVFSFAACVVLAVDNVFIITRAKRE